MSPRTTRRSFLQLLGAGAAFTSLAQLRCAPTPPGTRAVAADFFDPRERELLTQVAERMVESGDPRAPALGDTDAVAVIERVCAGLDPAISAPLPSLLRLVDWAPLLFEFRLTRWSRMSAEARDASLRGWMTSRIELRRRAFYALRNLAFLGYYSQDASWASIGYAGPLLGRPSGPR